MHLCGGSQRQFLNLLYFYSSHFVNLPPFEIRKTLRCRQLFDVFERVKPVLLKKHFAESLLVSKKGNSSLEQVFITQEAFFVEL